MAPGVASLPSSATSFFEREKVRNQQVTKPRLHSAERLVLEALHKRIQSIDLETSRPGEDDPFFVADIGEIHRLHREWTRQLDRVTPFFAVKCNPNPVVLRLLAALGTGFDCASVTEIRTILSMGVDPSRIVFANPCKIMSAIKYAREQGVSKMTFDSAEELHKIKQIFPEAQLFLRIVACDPSALCQLSEKFGARVEATEKLLKLAKSLELDVVGVSFHVGSGGKDPTAFSRAVHDASIVLGQAEQLGFRVHTLDIGGGFSAGPLFAETAGIINAALDKYVSRDIRVIAEPGRYMVNSAFTAAATVIAKRGSDPHGTESNNLKTTMLYINDGTYGSHYNSLCEVPAVPKVFRRANCTILEDRWGIELAPMQEYSIWGPTCDSVDCVNPTCRLPGNLEIGDWIYYRGMGAYTTCTASGFNGFTSHLDVLYVCSEPLASALLEDFDCVSS
ncbi:ornithine decarboxylase [Phyllosticta capitalensis]|uniref:ornithine decarboxylase n=1 Tax=Phyllosticta capitalensis TaxID=121624 RepID=A0ABR1YPR8_9PEZI